MVLERATSLPATLLNPFSGARQILRVQHSNQLGYCFVGIARPLLKVFAENLASLRNVEISNS